MKSIDRRGLVPHIVGVLVVAVTLTACSSSTPGVLTQSDVPSNLGLTANPSATASESRHVGADPPCKKAGVTVFTVPGWRVPKGGLISSANSPVVVNAVDACATSSDARSAFTSAFACPRCSTVEIGDEARLIPPPVSGQRVDIVGWREGNQIGQLLVLGPATDKRITPALVELLARRAAART